MNTHMLYTELHVGPAAARTPSTAVASPRAATPRPPRPRSRQMLLHYTSRAASPRPPRSRFYDFRTSPRSRLYDIRTSELHIFSIAPSTLRPWLAKNVFFLPCASLASTRPPRMNFPQHRYHSQRKIFLLLLHPSIHGTNMRPCIIRSLLRTSVCATSLSFPRSSRVRLGIEWIENLTTFQPSNATLQSATCITPPQGA